MLNRYEANYFDSGQWRHIDKICIPGYRDKPYKFPSDSPYEDTLKVKVWEEGITLPYVLREY